MRACATLGSESLPPSSSKSAQLQRTEQITAEPRSSSPTFERYPAHHCAATPGDNLICLLGALLARASVRSLKS